MITQSNARRSLPCAATFRSGLLLGILATAFWQLGGGPCRAPPRFVQAFCLEFWPQLFLTSKRTNGAVSALIGVWVPALWHPNPVATRCDFVKKAPKHFGYGCAFTVAWTDLARLLSPSLWRASVFWPLPPSGLPPYGLPPYGLPPYGLPPLWRAFAFCHRR